MEYESNFKFDFFIYLLFYKEYANKSLGNVLIARGIDEEKEH